MIIKNIFYPRWLRGFSISKKLYFVLGIMAFLILVELFALWFSINTLSSVRAYVAAEGLWSKAQKDAIYHLRKYARSGKEEDYQQFLHFLKVPLNDRIARIELSKENPDYDLLRRCFIQGGNHPDDVDGMINLFRRFHGISYINKAIKIWTEGDSLLADLQISADRLHSIILTLGMSSPEKIEDNLNQIDKYNARLTILEDNFSAALGEGSRWLENLVLKILFFIAITVEFTGIFLTISVSMGISKGINETMRVVKKISSGDFTERAKIYSEDEIGRLSGAFNNMADELESYIHRLNNSQEQLKKSNDQFYRIFELSPVATTISGIQDGKIIYVNSACEKLLVIKKDDLIDKTAVELNILPSEIRAELARQIQAERGVRGLELKMRASSNAIIDVLLSTDIIEIDNKKCFLSTMVDISERKKSEEKNSQLAAIIKTTQEAIISANTDGIITSWNLGAEKIYGYKPDEIIGKSASVLVPQESISEFKKFLFRVQHGEYIERYEALRVRKDGRQIFVSASLSPIKDNNEKMIGIAAIHRDITKIKKIEFKLKESEELHRTVLESLSEGLIITDNDDRIIYTNPRMEELSGYSRNEMKNKIAFELFLSEQYHEEMKNKMIHRLAGIDERYEIWMKKKNGIFFCAEVRAAPYRNSEGRIIGTVGSITDITSKKREQELEKLAVAATQSYNSVVIADRNGKIEWVNDGFTQLTGYRLEDVKNTHGEILRKGDMSGLNRQSEFYDKVLKTKKPIVYENKNYTQSGKEYWVVTTLTPVLSPDNEVEKIIAIDSNITEQKMLEEELRIANQIAEHSLMKGNKALDGMIKAKQELEHTMKVKEKFLANMSHEIRTPMNGIIGLTNLLLKGELTDKQRECLTAIKSSGNTLMVVINDILDISKMEAGKMRFDEQPLIIPELCDYVTKLFTPKANEKHILLRKKIDSRIPSTLVGDTVRLNQILTNLVSNAVKFTDKGMVTISAQLFDENESFAVIKFCVEDTGKGIPNDKISSIFLDFTQVDAHKMRDVEGTGLGLAITKRLVELQQGTISVDSKVGVGSKFTVMLRFKKYKNEKQYAAIQKIENNEEKLIGLKVLIVEDNAVNLMVAEQILRNWGCSIDTAENGKEAIELILGKEYDLVLLDIKMPVMDGYEAAHYIRTKMSAPRCNVPIIALTAHAATWEAEKCLEAGMNDFITKPFNEKELQKKVQTVIAEKHQRK